jgi:hypothetical protein
MNEFVNCPVLPFKPKGFQSLGHRDKIQVVGGKLLSVGWLPHIMPMSKELPQTNFARQISDPVHREFTDSPRTFLFVSMPQGFKTLGIFFFLFGLRHSSKTLKIPNLDN